MLATCISDPTPSVLDGIKSVNASQTGDEDIFYSVQVKNCHNNFFVYRLPLTPNDKSGYCFGKCIDLFRM